MRTCPWVIRTTAVVVKWVAASGVIRMSADSNSSFSIMHLRRRDYSRKRVFSSLDFYP